MEIFEQAMIEDKENLIEKVRGIYGFKVIWKRILKHEADANLITFSLSLFLSLKR